MRAREAVTQTMAASEAKRNWSKVINRAFSGEVRIVVQKHGIPVAASSRPTTLRSLPDWMRGGRGTSRFSTASAERFVTRHPSRSRKP